jgi:hypothetical protein
MPELKLPYEVDKELELKLYDAMMRAILQASMTTDGGLCHVRTNEVMAATLKIQALLLATSPDAMNAKELKYWSQGYEKHLRKYTLAFKDEILKGGFPWPMHSPETKGHA